MRDRIMRQQHRLAFTGFIALAASACGSETVPEPETPATPTVPDGAAAAEEAKLREEAFALCFEQQEADGQACSCWSLFAKKHATGATEAQTRYVESETSMCNPAADPTAQTQYPVVKSAWDKCFGEFGAALKRPESSNLAFADRLGLLGQHCGANMGMLPSTNIIVGTQYKEDGANVYVIHLEAGVCYSILAAGDDTVGDLDMALRYNGTNIAKDTAKDNYPSVGHCPAETGTYQILIAVEEGRGHYALQVWKRPKDAAEAKDKPTLTVSL
jgi:hypothetical protein